MREREQKVRGGDMIQTDLRGFEDGTASQEKWAPQEFQKGKNGFRRSLGTEMEPFINVCCAGACAHKYCLD